MDNLGPLCRTDHLLKTFGGHGVRQLRPGVYEWTTPTGMQFIGEPGRSGQNEYLGTLGYPHTYRGEQPAGFDEDGDHPRNWAERTRHQRALSRGKYLLTPPNRTNQDGPPPF